MSSPFPPGPGCLLSVCLFPGAFCPDAAISDACTCQPPSLVSHYYSNLPRYDRYAHTEVWRKGRHALEMACCFLQKRVRILSLPIIREVAASYGWACKAVAVLTLHVSVAISGASKLCIKKLLRFRNFIWARRKNSLASGHASSAPTPRRVVGDLDSVVTKFCPHVVYMHAHIPWHPASGQSALCVDRLASTWACSAVNSTDVLGFLLPSGGHLV